MSTHRVMTSEEQGKVAAAEEQKQASVVVDLPGLAADEFDGGQAGQDVMLGRDPEDCEEPEVVRVWSNARIIRRGKGHTRRIETSSDEVLDFIAVTLEALLSVARDQEQPSVAAAIRTALVRIDKARRRLAELQR